MNQFLELMDRIVSRLAALGEPIIGVRGRMAFIEWYGTKRGWETFAPHRMSKEQIDRTD